LFVLLVQIFKRFPQQSVCGLKRAENFQRNSHFSSNTSFAKINSLDCTEKSPDQVNLKIARSSEKSQGVAPVFPIT